MEASFLGWLVLAGIVFVGAVFGALVVAFRRRGGGRKALLWGWLVGVVVMTAAWGMLLLSGWPRESIRSGDLGTAYGNAMSALMLAVVSLLAGWASAIAIGVRKPPP